MKLKPATTAASCSEAFDKDAVERGMVVCAPGSIAPPRELFFLTAGVTGVITVDDGMPVQPGIRCDVQVTLQRPVAIDVGLTFA